MANKHRIGIACFATYGGSGVVATELGRELARAGHSVHFISNQIPFRLNQGEFFDNVYYHEVDTMTYDALAVPMFGFELSSKIIQIAIDERLDIIHAHYAVPHAIGGIIAKNVLHNKRRIKVVVTLHGTDITLVGRAPAFYPLTQWAIEQSDAVTTVSDWLRRETLQAFETAKPIHVIHNFIDTQRFQPGISELPRERLAKPHEKILMHMSNFRPVKRLGDVVEVFARVAQEMPARLVLIGDGPERERTLEHARQLGVMDRTFFLGKQTNIESYLSLADLFLFPSEYESFGVAALEAMACEVPVVATQGSGISEVVLHERTGLLAPMGDVAGMAAASLRILRDPALSAQMGAAGRRRATQCFQASAIRERYERVYDALLAGYQPECMVPCTELSYDI